MRVIKRMRWGLVAGLVLATSIGAVAAAAAPLGSEPGEDAVAALWAPTHHHVANDARVRDGIWLAADHVYDDTGPDLDGSAGGDRGYPRDEHHRNAADLVELRIGRDAVDVLVGVRLNAVNDVTHPIIAIGFGDGAAPATTWPHGVGVQATGVHTVLTITSDGARLNSLTGGPSHDLPVDVRNDLHGDARRAENTFTVRVPVQVTGPSFDVYAVAGLRDGDGWLDHGDGAPAPYDAFFQPVEDFTAWQQQRQAAMLASGDLSTARRHVRLDRLRAPDDWEPPTGRVAGLHRSSVEDVFPEGVHDWHLEPRDDLAAPVPLGASYDGLFHPYTLWVPPDHDGTEPLPLFFYLHGFGGDHLGLNAWADGRIDVDGIAYSPLGRAPFGFFIGPGEVDVMDGFRHVVDHWNIDTDRVFLSGSSMGGFGTYRLAVRYADLFAAAIPLIGTGMSDEHLVPPPLEDAIGPRAFGARMPGGGLEMLENTRNLPFRNFNGVIDWLVNSGFVSQDLLRFRQLGHDHQYHGFLARHHETVPEFTNVLYHQVLDGCAGGLEGCLPQREPTPLVRDPNPATVVFKLYPEILEPELGLVYDGLYWLSGVTVRDAAAAGSNGMVSATSHGHADKLDEPTSLGPSVHTYAPTRDVYLWEGVRRTEAPRPRRNTVELRLSNIATAALDVPRMNVSLDGLVLHVGGDGRTRITLAGEDVEAVEVTRDGTPFTDVTVEAGDVVLDADVTGTAIFRIAVVPASVRSAQVDSSPLPATGGGIAGALGLLAVWAGLGHRRRTDVREAGTHGADTA